VTYQATQKQKYNAFVDMQRGCNGAQWIGTTGSGCRGTPSGWIESGAATSTQAPEVRHLLDAAEHRHAGELDLHAVEPHAG
jgi:hypothetical protein